jgi:hypothetical protein
MSAYKVIRGITYGNKRAEAGDIVTDIPDASTEWLIASGIIEPSEAPQPKQTKQPKAKSEPVSDDKGDE